MALSVHDVGSRVVLRRSAGVRDGRPVFSDVLGELLTWGDVVVVRTADGTEVSVPRHEVAAGKRIPPRPERRPGQRQPGRLPERRPEQTQPRPLPERRAEQTQPRPRPGVLELERIAALGWRGLHTEQLGGWLLRASGGWTGRANSVLPLGDPGVDLDAALAHVTRWYAAHGLPALIQVPLPARADLSDALHARGWADAWGARVLTADIPTILSGLPERTSLPPVEFATEPSAEWLGAYHYRGGALPDVAVEVLRGGDAPFFASVVEGGAVSAIARGVLDEGWVGITAVEVEGAQRRRGLATHLLRGLLEYGVERGAHSAYLQVDLANDVAQALYQRVGFTTHHTYMYVKQPQERLSGAASS
jgi:GNAT superfamily N-acetyltransferase